MVTDGLLKPQAMKINLDFTGGFNYRKRHARPFGIRIRRTSKNQSPPCRLAHIVRQTNRYGLAASREFASGLLEFSVKIDPPVYSQIMRDMRISHGAFRLWHILRDMTGTNKNCFPAVRYLATTLKAHKNSILTWIMELEAALYLRVERGNKHRSNRYYVLSGGSVSYSGHHRGAVARPPGGAENQTQSIPIIESKNQGQGARSKETTPALPKAEKKNLRVVTPEATAAFLAGLRAVVSSVKVNP